MKFIAIVNEGEWGIQRREGGDYDIFNRYLVDLFKAGENGETEGRVKVIATTDQALLEIKTQGADSGAVLVFTTRGMLERARLVKQEHPDLRVAILTGLPDGIDDSDLVVIDKINLTKESVVRSLLG